MMLDLRLSEKLSGAPMFLGIPDHWFEPRPRFRCENGHVSTMVLKSEKVGDCCLKCGGGCMITYPEDEDDMPDELAGDSTSLTRRPL